MKVLVVEDDPNLRALWGAVLERQGHAPRLEETEAGARRALAEGLFDLLLLDLHLGPAQTLDIATIAALVPERTRIVVVTGTSLYPKGALLDSHPAVTAVLRKPVDIEDVLAVCDHVARGAGPFSPELARQTAIETRS